MIATCENTAKRPTIGCRRLAVCSASVASASTSKKGVLRSGFRGLFPISLVKAIDASCRIYQLLFAGKERVASRADFHVQVTLACRTGFESFATGADNVDFSVFGVNSRFHYFFSRYRRPQAVIFKRVMIGARDN
jgi:hypothetical protein